MTRSRDLEKTLSSLSALRNESDMERVGDRLREALGAKSPAVVARAAKLAADLEVDGLEPALCAAFETLIGAGARGDRGCVVKIAIADALYRLGLGDGAVFLAGVRLRQPEGGNDAAAGLRAVSAFGLVRLAHPEALDRIAELLADPEPSVRLAAVRALAYREHDSGGPLLRLKASLGDADVDVTAEALCALLRVTGGDAREFVTRTLEAGDVALQHATALALGGTREPAAFDVLHRLWDRTRDSAVRDTVLTAIASLRSDRALDFLIGLVAEAPGPSAREALGALALFREDETLASRIRSAAAAREDVDLSSDLAQTFGG